MEEEEEKGEAGGGEGGEGGGKREYEVGDEDPMVTRSWCCP